MFFLNGEMFPQLKANVKLLRSSPKNIVKSWAQNTPHILGFVNTLIRHQVVNKQKILDIWKKDQFCMFIVFCYDVSHEIFQVIKKCVSFKIFQIFCKSIAIS